MKIRFFIFVGALALPTVHAIADVQIKTRCGYFCPKTIAKLRKSAGACYRTATAKTYGCIHSFDNFFALPIRFAQNQNAPLMYSNHNQSPYLRPFSVEKLQ